jgi:hypothetical protein
MPSKPVLIILNGQAVYVGSGTVKVIDVEDVDIDEDSLKRLINRASSNGARCIEVTNSPNLRVYDCTEPGEDEFINEVEDLIEDE